MAFEPFTKNDMPTMANFNAKFLSAIEEATGQALADGVKIQVGEYKGTGTYGSANRSGLSFDFTPQAIFIVDRSLTYANHLQGGFIWIKGQNIGVSAIGVNSSNKLIERDVQLIWSDDSISWYTTMADAFYGPLYQLNGGSLTYSYLAIGWKETI